MTEFSELKRAEIASLETEARIISRFREKSRTTNKAPSAIMQDIAYEERYTLPGVRKLLIRNGEYTPKRKEIEDDSTRDASGE